ncbi:GNAT family N-acetyltransferase [Kitasatospora sp. NPDC057904]|uniref:GNAT family N-acetyltransferase n=1 Tax=Kitasatospora sp. NPDC057904 TaxID=3346275 RepID=UPI0036D98551
MTSADHAPAIPSTTASATADPHLLDEIERYYDAVPRSAARTEDFGPLTLFVRDGAGWPYYARPTLGHDGPAVTADDVLRVLARQRELGVPEAFEWVAEHDPELRAAVEGAGLTVHEHPLLVLGPADEPGAAPAPAERVEVRVLAADAPELAAALAVPRLAFADPGTGIGAAGTVELATAEQELAADGTARRVAERITAGTTVLAAALEDGTPLCAGQHNPVGPVTEVGGVGTLPAARRRGLGLAVTAALVAHARANGVRTVFLSAADEDVARIYRRAGFRPFATALIAEPATPDGTADGTAD